MNVTGDGSKVQCCWNVRSMNQDELEVVKQKMARVNIAILGISELKWTGMREFNSDDHFISYCGQEALRRNVHFQGKPFNITVIQVHALTCNAEEAEFQWFYEDLQELLELTPKKKDVLFIIGE